MARSTCGCYWGFQRMGWGNSLGSVRRGIPDRSRFPQESSSPSAKILGNRRIDVDRSSRRGYRWRRRGAGCLNISRRDGSSQWIRFNIRNNLWFRRLLFRFPFVSASSSFFPVLPAWVRATCVLTFLLTWLIPFIPSLSIVESAGWWHHCAKSFV